MAFGRNEPSAVLMPESDDAGYGRARRRVFLLTALTVLVMGVVYTLLQPARFESTATVLMSAPTAIDQQMLDADVQGVAIQRRTLTGTEITRALAETLAADFGVSMSVLELRELLDVRPVADTNLLELVATGSQSELLPPMVESWIDVYTRARALDTETRKSQTLAEVEGELTGLDVRLAAAREALDSYRAENEIISMERQENAVLSQLDGLNKALNQAVQEEVSTKAYFDTLRDSIEEGEQVVPGAERGEVDAMAQRLATLRARLGELRSRYTDEYIMKDPRLREIPRQIEELQLDLAQAYVDGTQAELANAERAWETAREKVADLERRLDAHKQSVAQFNTIYAKHQALVQDLARLEELNRETQARQVQIEVRQIEKYPQVAVIDWPQPQARRIGPPYLLLLGGTLAAAVLAGVFGVWLYSYLHPRPASSAYVTLSGVHMYPQDAAQALGHAATQTERLGRAPAGRISPPTEEDSTDEAGDQADSDDDASGKR